MSCLLSLLIPLFLPAQEPPLLHGAYRGPFDEVLVESSKTEQGVSYGNALDGWDRWEFWFAFEKASLFRPGWQGRADLRRLRVSAGEEWALDREKSIALVQPVLLRAIASPEPQLREAAALALGRLGEAGPAREALIDAVTGDGSPSVRNAALLALGQLADSESLGFLAERFRGSGFGHSERAFAALGLGLSGRGEAVDLLRLYLSRNLNQAAIVGGEESVAQAAVWGAGLLADPALVPSLLTGYERLERSGAVQSRRVRTLILQALARCGDPQALSWMERALRSPDPAIQRAAALAMGRLGEEEALSTLIEKIREGGDSETVNFCLLAIGRIGGPEAEAHLKDLYALASRHRQHLAFWYLAAGMNGSPELDAYLEAGFLHRANGELEESEYRRRDEERLRGAQAVAMGLRGEARFVQPLQEVLEEPGTSPDLAGFCAVALGRIGGPDAAEALLRAEQEGPTQSDFRRGLVLGLALARDARTLERLGAVLAEERRAEVRWEALHAAGLTPAQGTLDRLLLELEDPGELRRSEAHTAHLLAGLGYLMDPRAEDGLASLLNALNYRQEFPLLRAVAGY